jgi:intracellular septation protein
MKLLFDFLPIVLFFGMFKYAEGHKDWAAAQATDWFGFMVSGGSVGQTEAPVLLATVVVMAATLAQIAWLLARGKKIEPMLWISLALVVGLGGATVYFHNEAFIKWKPTGLYWAMGGTLLFGMLVLKKNFIRTLMGQQMELPEAAWTRMCWSWIGFFAAMGCINLWVAYTFSTDTWVNFKLFGGLGLMLVFVLAQAAYLSRYTKSEP